MVELISAPQCLLVFVHRNQRKITDVYPFIYYDLGLVSVLAHSGLGLVSLLLTTTLSGMST